MERHFIRLVLYNLSLLIFFFVIIVKLFLIARVDYDQSLSYMRRDNINFIFCQLFSLSLSRLFAALFFVTFHTLFPWPRHYRSTLHDDRREQILLALRLAHKTGKA